YLQVWDDQGAPGRYHDLWGAEGQDVVHHGPVETPVRHLQVQCEVAVVLGDPANRWGIGRRPGGVVALVRRADQGWPGPGQLVHVPRRIGPCPGHFEEPPG